MKIRLIAVSAVIAVVAGATPVLAGPQKQTSHRTGTGSLSDSAVITPDQENLSSAYWVDVVEGYKGSEFDRINIVDDNGRFSLRHEALPNGEAVCDFASFAQVRGNPGEEQTWVETLGSTGTATVDGGFVCHTTPWGGNQNSYSLRFGSAEDFGMGCWTITKAEDGSYAITVPTFTPERTETKTYPAEPGLPVVGGGEPERTETTTYPAEGCRAELYSTTTNKGQTTQTLLDGEVSAPFTYTFTVNS